MAWVQWPRVVVLDRRVVVAETQPARVFRGPIGAEKKGLIGATHFLSTF